LMRTRDDQPGRFSDCGAVVPARHATTGGGEQDYETGSVFRFPHSATVHDAEDASILSLLAWASVPLARRSS
jgi:hypothetical protein